MNVWLAELWRAWRGSLRRPAFVLLASSVLALGVGASVGVFTLIDHTLLRPLPYPQSQQLIQLGQLERGYPSSVSPQQYQQLSGLAGVQSIGLIESFTPPVNIAGDGPPQQVPAMYADRGLLPTLRVQPALGRNFSAEEDAPHGPKAVILAHGFWLRRFGGAPAVIGQRLQVEGDAYTIVGVLPKTFQLLDGDLLLPTALQVGTTSDGTNYMVVARLRPGVAARTVSAQVDTRLHALYAHVDGSDSNTIFWQKRHFGGESLQVALHAEARPVLGLFVASAVLVLLIALLNLTNLMFLRALARGHDVAVRAALGAPRLRLALPALAEGLLVGSVGGVFGLMLAVAGLAALQSFMPDDWPSAPCGWVPRGGC